MRFATQTPRMFVLLSLLACSMAQGPKRTFDRNKIHVSILLDKKEYQQGEPISYRLVLSNDSVKGIYVSKLFGEGGGGIAGFYVNVKQLSGRKANQGCNSNADVFPSEEKRRPEQILKEDFLVLWPRRFVGTAAHYSGCEATYPGLYELTAEYSAQDWKMDKVRDASDDAAEVLTGEIHARPVRFRVVPKSKK